MLEAVGPSSLAVQDSEHLDRVPVLDPVRDEIRCANNYEFPSILDPPLASSVRMRSKKFYRFGDLEDYLIGRLRAVCGNVSVSGCELTGSTSRPANRHFLRRSF